MYNQNYNQQGGYQPNGYSQPSPASGKQKKEEPNKMQCIGIVRPLNEQDTQLNIKTFENGKSGMLFKIVTTEDDGADKNGQPQIHHETFNVAVSTNKSITIDILRSITIGSKLYVIGPYRTRSYTDKNSGQMRSTREIKPYFIKQLANPMQPGQQPYGQPYGQQMPQYPPQPAYGQQYPQGGYVPQQQMPPQYAPQPMPQQAPPYYQQPQQPAYPPQGGYAPQGGYGPQQQPRPAQQAPQYTQQPQGRYPSAPAGAPAYCPDDDLPPDSVPGKTINL